MSPSRPDLKLDWCSHDAAKFAVEHWHYSRTLPMPPLVRIGVWERGAFIGAILFARGANRHLLDPYGLDVTEGAELVRVALTKHETPVSRIVAIAVRLLKRHAPGLRLIVSYADQVQGHVGGIYQAGGWLYCGTSVPGKTYIGPDGKKWHSRMVKSSGFVKVYGKQTRVFTPEQCVAIATPGKHRYLLALDDEIRARIEPLRKPYPKKHA